MLLKDEISVAAIEDHSTGIAADVTMSNVLCIQVSLHTDEGGSFKVCPSSPPTSTAPLVRMCGLSASWSHDRDKTELKDINFEMTGV